VVTTPAHDEPGVAVADALQVTATTVRRRHPSARGQFIRRRLTRLLISVWVLITFSFLIIHLVPGDPVRAALGLTADPALVARMRADLGLNDALVVQYFRFIGHLFTGDLGVSLQNRLPVADTIADRLPSTVQIAVLAFLVIVVVAIPVGVGMAVLTRGGRRRGTELTYTSLAVVTAAIPEFLLGVVFVYLFAVSVQLLPIAGKSGLSSYILPVASLSIGAIAALSRVVRVETLSILGEDFVRTARAKRLPGRLIYLRHALPNAITATLTIGGLLLSSLVTGTVLVETIFAWPGLGQSLVTSILTKDYPLMQGIVLVYGGMVLIINLLVDVALAVIDPRSTIVDA
jgi:ABC-type dipeptide/oligopeptide/nickel transport system permease component